MGKKIKANREGLEKEMNILNIDSTSSKLFITLSRQGEILSPVSRKSNRRYMEMILDDIDRMLKKAGLDIGEIDAIGVNKGPGDFTGTRIGISVVKTLGWVLNIPVYGINALDVLAHSIANSSKGIINKTISSGKSIFVLPCLDVRKDELYFSYYEIKENDQNQEKADNIASITIKDKSYGIIRREDMKLLDAEDFTGSFDNWLASNPAEKTVIIGGNCTSEYSKMLSGLTRKAKDIYLDRKNTLPEPASLDICVRKTIKTGAPGDMVNPVYVRDFAPFGK
jgi:tRNA threonylcarbamoyl adenosine modification protein YeaZ